MRHDTRSSGGAFNRSEPLMMDMDPATATSPGDTMGGDRASLLSKDAERATPPSPSSPMASAQMSARQSMRTAELDKELMLAITKKDFQMSHSPVAMELPESIYGAAMMAVIRSSQSYHNVVHGVTLCIVGGLILNVITQLYVLICTKLYITGPAVLKVRDLYNRYEDEVWSGGEYSQKDWMDFPARDELCQLPLSQPLFFLAILAIWTGTCWVDLLESIRYASLWIELPHPETGRHLHRTEVEEDGGEVVVTHADLHTKMIVVAAISVPKILICIFLWWLGSRWLVATTSFQDLLLNAVALAFVTELDELIYMCFIPFHIQEMVKTFKISQPPMLLRKSSGRDPPTCHLMCGGWSQIADQADVPDDEQELAMFLNFRDRRLAWTMARMILTGVVVVGLPILYMKYLQQVLPNYRWDVHEVCEQHMGAIAASGGG